MGTKPLSPWLIGAFMLALLWGGLYLGFNSGGFRQDVYESDAVSWAGGGSAVQAAPDPKVIGKRIYSQNCIVCQWERRAGPIPSLGRQRVGGRRLHSWRQSSGSNHAAWTSGTDAGSGAELQQCNAAMETANGRPDSCCPDLHPF